MARYGKFFDSSDRPLYVLWDVTASSLIAVVAGASVACSGKDCCVGMSSAALALQARPFCFFV